MVRARGATIAALLVAVSLAGGAAFAGGTQCGCDLNGEWILIVTGLRYGIGDCLPQPYCAVTRIGIDQLGCEMYWYNLGCGTKDAQLAGIAGGRGCDSMTWERLVGFVGGGRLWITSACGADTYGPFGHVSFTGRPSALCHMLSGDFLEAICGAQGGQAVGASLVDGFGAIRGRFMAFRLTQGMMPMP